MVDGLDVGKKEFMKMGSKDRDGVMFDNMVHLRGKVKNDVINRRVQYIWLICLTGIMGIRKFLGL